MKLYITLADKYHTRYNKGTVIKLRWNFKRDFLCNIKQFITNSKAKDKIFFFRIIQKIIYL